MKITLKFLKDKSACADGVDWCEKNNLIGLDAVPFLEKLIENNKLDWASWLIVRVMASYKDYVSYAVFAAEQVIDIYERKYPNDGRPRKAIEAAKLCIKNPSKKNKSAAAGAIYAASHTAWHAAHFTVFLLRDVGYHGFSG